MAGDAFSGHFFSFFNGLNAEIRHKINSKFLPAKKNLAAIFLSV
jgi:hypothetical protein